MTLPVVFTANGSSAYNLTNSLRIRESASAYLNRTPSSAGNAQKFTMSCWVKLGSTSQTAGQMTFLNAGNGSQSNSTNDQIQLRTNGTALQVTCLGGGGTGGNYAQFNAYLRDYAAWYHIVVAVDTTQATQANRCKAYINGVEQTAYSANGFTLNYSFVYINSTSAHLIGKNNEGGGPVYTDTYFAEYNFIGGQQLTSSSFGSTNPATGVWQPLKYTGTYGTNGFYLPFTDNSALTTSSNVGLGKDFSGNGNYWTTNNISITTGSTYDSMTDVPTLTSATQANYCVMNPLASSSTYLFPLSNGNLTASGSSGGYLNDLGTIYFDVTGSNGYYWEFYSDASSYSGGGITSTTFVGSNIRAVTNGGSAGYTWATIIPYAAGSFYVYNNGAGSYATTSRTLSAGWYGVAVKNGKVWFRDSNGWFTGDPVAGTSPLYTGLTGNYTPCLNYESSGSTTAHINFGQQPLQYSAPTGFVALNTFNLPTSTIVKGNTVMDATLYTGNDTAGTSITNAAGFKPDLVWSKVRSGAGDHGLWDSVRGASNRLVSNSTSAEGSVSGVTAFNSNGFTLGAAYNVSPSTYVGWQWQAGQGTTSSNTSGSITSTVSVNASAGFSVVTYTGNGTGGATIGHGLGVAPAMFILKARSASGLYWVVYHQSLGATKALFLQLTDAANTDIGYFNNTAPTSSVLSLGSGASANQNGTTYVAYCWSQIAGFSSFGSYTGNGSTDGPFVYTGFRPKYVLIKGTSASRGWEVMDSSRDTYNAVIKTLQPDLSDAEYSNSAYSIDFLSNGFKLRNTNTYWNGSGETYIYMAFAENPFKNALAR